jgi:hypothetical protein
MKWEGQRVTDEQVVEHILSRLLWLHFVFNPQT